MSPQTVEKRPTSRPAAVPRLALQSTVSPRMSPRALGYPMPPQSQRRSLGSSCARSSPRLWLGSPKSGSVPEIRISPRFGQASQPDLASPGNKKAVGRQAKAEAAHISRRRDSLSGMSGGRKPSSTCIEQKTEHIGDSGRNPCIGDRRPNPLLGGNKENQQATDKQGPVCNRSPSFSQLGESSISESVQSSFEAVLEERASYMSLFGDEDSDIDIDACSFGSYGDKVTELCQRAESLVRDMSQDLDASMTRSASTPATYAAPLLFTATLLDEEDPSTWPSSATCEVRQALFAELGASSTPLPTPPVTPLPTPPALPTETSSCVGEEAEHTQPASSSCPFQELGAIVTLFGTPPATPVASRTRTHSPSASCVGEDDPSLWPDLQPWLRSMCNNSQNVAGTNDAPQRKEGGVQLSDLQFRVSRLELQVGQITSPNDKPSVAEEVAELRKHVETAQAELQVTRSEARETQEQLRWLLQYAGAGVAEVVAGGPQRSGVACPVMVADMPCARGGRPLRSASVSSQDSQALTVRQGASVQPSVSARSPVQMPRARSEDSSRRRFYPMTSSRQQGSEKRLPQVGCGTQDKLATKRKSFPSPVRAPRVVDVPVRMCTSQQLVQVVKQKPMWLKKVSDNYVDRMVSRSSSGAGQNSSPPVRSRGLKSERHA